MARSRVRGTNGQPRKKNKNRDSLLASQQVWTQEGVRGDSYRIRKKNDNKPEYLWHNIRYVTNTETGKRERQTTTTKVKDDENSRNPVAGGRKGAVKDTRLPASRRVRASPMRGTNRTQLRRLQEFSEDKVRNSDNYTQRSYPTKRKLRGTTLHDILPPPRY